MELDALKTAVRKFNDSGLAKGKIKMIGVTKDQMAKLFVEGVAALGDKGNELPDECIDAYNVLVEGINAEAGATAGAAETAAPEKPAEEKKDDKKADKKKDTKKDDKKKTEGGETKKKGLFADRARNKYGHVDGCQSAKLDDLLEKGGKLAEMAAAIGSSENRVLSHVKHLQEAKNITVEEKDGFYKIKA